MALLLCVHSGAAFDFLIRNKTWFTVPGKLVGMIDLTLTRRRYGKIVSPTSTASLHFQFADLLIISDLLIWSIEHSWNVISFSWKVGLYHVCVGCLRVLRNT